MKTPSLLTAALLALVPLALVPTAAAECQTVALHQQVASERVLVTFAVCDDATQCGSLATSLATASECDAVACADAAQVVAGTTLTGCGDELCLETANEEEGRYVINAHACGDGGLNCNIQLKPVFHVHC